MGMITYTQPMSAAPEVQVRPIRRNEMLLRCGEVSCHAVYHRGALRGRLFIPGDDPRRLNVRPITPEQFESEAHRLVRQGWAMLEVARRLELRVADLVVVGGDPATTFIEPYEEVEA
jgi:hypothetical protein